MKTKILTFAAIIFTIISCNKTDSTDQTRALIGTWELKEILSDPGDGSGKFNPVISNKKITFDGKGNLTSNGSICNLSVEANTSAQGIYNETNLSIIPANCQHTTIRYALTGDTLILYYQCFEPCRAKYLKTQ